MLFFEEFVEAGAPIKVKVLWVEDFAGINDLEIGGLLFAKKRGHRNLCSIGSIL